MTEHLINVCDIVYENVEKGYNALPGVIAQPINSWIEFKKCLKELAILEVQEKYQTIVIDTADIAYAYCEKYICSREGVENVSDIPYGKGYSMIGNEFDESIRKILQLNYGLVLISHSTDKVFKDTDGNEYNQIVPTLDKRGRLICERTCDIIGFSTVVNTENGPQTRLFMRETPRYVAGSRFKYIPDSIEFSYNNLVNAIKEAIDKQAAENGGMYVTDARTQVVTQDVSYDFETLMKQFQDAVGQLMSKNQSNGPKITSIVEKHLGRGKKVGDCTPDQAEHLSLIIDDLKSLL